LLSDSAAFTFASGNLTLGAASSVTGKLSLKGSTSGTVDITTADAAGTWTMTLPANDGDANQVLQTNGSGVTSWVAQSGGMANPMTTIGDIIYASDTGTPSTPARLAGGSTGQILQSNTGAAPSWSTATFPATATGTGTILRADGTNWAASTATYPNTTTANQILYSTATNVVGGDSGLTFDGTTMIIGSSTEVFTVLDTGKIGISATSPTYDLSFGGDAARTISLERNTTTHGNGLTLSAGGALSGGTNLNGGQLYLKGGTSTGSGGSSDIFLQTATSGSSGTSDNTPTTKLTIRGNGNVVVGTAALATDATGGFLYIPSSAGTPTGTPTTETGTVPIQYDTTNNALYAYRGGAWHYFAETAGFQIPDYEKIDPISGEEIKEGDFVVGMVNGTMPNDNLHGIWVSWNSVKAKLLAEARGELSRTSGTWGTGTVDGIESGTFLEKVKNILFSLGIEIKDGVTNIATLARKKLSADTADIKQVSVETMQMVDKTTGEIYCTWISNGQLVKAKGECSTIDFNNAVASVVTTASQPAVENPVTTPVETTTSVQTEPVTPEAVQTQTQPQTTELTQQQQHAIEQAADQAAREASQQTASRISDEVAGKVQDKIEKEVKKEIEQQLKDSSNAEESSPAEKQQEELPVVEPEASLEPPIESATEETTPAEEAPSTGDLIQEATSSLLREATDAINGLIPNSFRATMADLLSAFGDFSSWMSKNISQTISNIPKIIQASKAGLIEIAQDGSKDFIKQARIGLEIKTPEIMEKSTAGFLAPIEKLWSNFVK
jgi:hypothetical protein